MWQKNNNRACLFILFALLWGHKSSYAAEVVNNTLQLQLQPQYQIQPQALEIVAPVITGTIPSSCVNPGDVVQIKGSNFPPQGAAGLAIGGNGQHLDATIKNWSTTQIDIVLPLSGLQPGKTYYFGVERSDHSRWLSNISQSLIMCKRPVSTHSSSAASLSRHQMQQSGSSSGFATAPPKNDTAPASSSDDVLPPTVTPSPGNLQHFTPSGGSLISGGLPPPPQAPELVEAIEENGVEPGEILILSANMDEARMLAQQVANYGMRPIRR
jgi:hypothetical protein